MQPDELPRERNWGAAALVCGNPLPSALVKCTASVDSARLSCCAPRVDHPSTNLSKNTFPFRLGPALLLNCERVVLVPGARLIAPPTAIVVIGNTLSERLASVPVQASSTGLGGWPGVAVLMKSMAGAALLVSSKVGFLRPGMTGR